MKTLLLVSLLTTGSFAAMAQVQRQIDRKPFATDSKAPLGNVSAREQKPGMREVFRKLDLTRQQQVQLKQIRQDQQAKKALIESNEQLSDPEKQKQIRELQKEFMTKLESVLTDEQKEKLKMLRQKQEPIPTDDKDG
ncbi:MAG: hypothetical protein J0L54_12920 [Chitinophagales bacterium]|nr:hypothetical protein [Chitinophagales bacterium]